MNTPLRRLSVVAFVLFATLLGSTTWIQFASAGDLRADSRNARTILAELSRERGPIVVGDDPVVTSVPVDDRFKYQRTYAEGEVYAPVTGFYSLVYGATGIEGAESRLLAGTADEQFFSRFADTVSGREPRGATVELTIDPAVQQAAWDALGDQRGAVVALDPSTGDVLAMVSKPSYDPQLLAGHERADVVAQWQALLADEGKPMTNRAIGGNLYPPGSVFKIVTAAAALESGAYQESSVLPGPAVLDLPQTSVGLPNSSGAACGPNGETTLTDALRISCNTAFGYLGMELGGAAVKEQADRFGFDNDLRIPLRVSPSTIPDDLNPPQEAQTGIGQYETRVTPLQVAMVSAAVANGGELMQPQLVRQVVRAGPRRAAVVQPCVDGRADLGRDRRRAHPDDADRRGGRHRHRRPDRRRGRGRQDRDRPARRGSSAARLVHRLRPRRRPAGRGRRGDRVRRHRGRRGQRRTHRGAGRQGRHRGGARPMSEGRRR